MKTDRDSSPFTVNAFVTIYKEGEEFIGPKQYNLIRQLIQDGSMNAAAKHLGISYQKIWQMVKGINDKASQPIIICQRGGKDGGGCIVSDYGKDLLKIYAQREWDVLQVLARSDGDLDDILF
jgi:molybdate transport system regulatory protein